MDFKIIREPYDQGSKIYKKSKVTINPGVSILVGCNGCGKTTFLRLIKNQLEDENILYMEYDNLTDGRLNQADAIFQFGGDPKYLATAVCSSEGENINMNFGIFISKIHRCIKSYKGYHKELFILADAIDSGLSIDNIISVKDVFNLIITDIKERYDFEVYILAVANEYELAKDMNCFDVVSGKYVQFSTYNAYRKFIIGSAEKKKLRIEKFEEYLDNEKENKKKE